MRQPQLSELQRVPLPLCPPWVKSRHGVARCDVRSIKTTQLIFDRGRNNHPEPSGKTALEFYEHFISAKGACEGPDPLAVSRVYSIQRAYP